MNTIDTYSTTYSTKVLSTCVLCGTCVHASNKKVTLYCVHAPSTLIVLVRITIHFTDVLPCVNPWIDDDEFHSMFGIVLL